MRHSRRALIAVVGATLAVATLAMPVFAEEGAEDAPTTQTAEPTAGPTTSPEPEPDPKPTSDPEPKPEPTTDSPKQNPDPKPDPKPSPQTEPTKPTQTDHEPEMLAPTAVDDTYDVPATGNLTVDAPGVLGNDDPRGAAVTLESGPEFGDLSLRPDGSFAYSQTVPISDSFTYRLESAGSSTTATVTLTARPAAGLLRPFLAGVGITAASGAVDDSYATPADTPLVVPAATGFLANDPPGSNLAAWSGAQHGTVSMAGLGGFTFTPEAGFSGTASFTYDIDSDPETTGATVTITVTPVGAAPIAVDDTYSTNVGQQLQVIPAEGVLANDSNATTAAIASDVSHGTLMLNTAGAIIYTPTAGYSGPDTFTYTANGSGGTSAPATATINVGSVSDLPVAADDSYTAEQDQTLTVDVADGVLKNDTNATSVTLIDDVEEGDLNLQPDGSFTYAPRRWFGGTVTFTYAATGADGTSEPATVTITVNEVATPGYVANDDHYSVDQGQTLSVPENGDPDLVANDTRNGVACFEPDHPCYIGIHTEPANGHVVRDAFGSFDYTPDPTFHGTDTFTYRFHDGPPDQQLSNTATVTITVNEVTPPAPVTNPDSFDTDQDDTLTIAAPGVLNNDDDADTVELVTSTSEGGLSLSNDGGFTYTPDAGFIGTDSFTYKATGAGGTSEPETVTITVHEIESAPIANDDSYDVDENETLTVDAPGVIGNDDDATGARLIAGTDHGTLDLGDDGSFTYEPDADYTGTDEFTYVATNDVQVGQLGRAVGGGLFTLDSEPATVTLNVVAASEDEESDDDDDDDDDSDEGGGDRDHKTALPDTGSPVGPTDLTAALLFILTGGILISATRRRGKHLA